MPLVVWTVAEEHLPVSLESTFACLVPLVRTSMSLVRPPVLNAHWGIIRVARVLLFVLNVLRASIPTARVKAFASIVMLVHTATLPHRFSAILVPRVISKAPRARPVAPIARLVSTLLSPGKRLASIAMSATTILSTVPRFVTSVSPVRLNLVSAVHRAIFA